jgi:Icc-related predicted phosphoesterase
MFCYFISDLHGHPDRYEKLFKAILNEKPGIVLLGGDILPSGLLSHRQLDQGHKDFIEDFLVSGFGKLRDQLGSHYPRVLMILGNDDGKAVEPAVLDTERMGLWEYIHNRRTMAGDYNIYGYSYVPPTPFRLKDWERYDVSRYVDPGCISPEEGIYSVPVSRLDLKFATIKNDLELLINGDDVRNGVFLFHSPPYMTKLDHASLDGIMIDNVLADANVGSIAIRRMIEQRQPLITLHGHVHESARITGSWKDKIGKTVCITAAHDGKELALVKFSLDNVDKAERELL